MRTDTKIVRHHNDSPILNSPVLMALAQILLPRLPFDAQVHNSFTATPSCRLEQARMLTDWVKVLRPTLHKIGHFGDILHRQSLDAVLKKLNLTQKSKQHKNKIA